MKLFHHLHSLSDEYAEYLLVLFFVFLWDSSQYLKVLIKINNRMVLLLGITLNCSPKKTLSLSCLITRYIEKEIKSQLHAMHLQSSNSPPTCRHERTFIV